MHLEAPTGGPIQRRALNAAWADTIGGGVDEWPYIAEVETAVAPFPLTYRQNVEVAQSRAPVASGMVVFFGIVSGVQEDPFHRPAAPALLTPTHEVALVQENSLNVGWARGKAAGVHVPAR